MSKTNKSRKEHVSKYVGRDWTSSDEDSEAEPEELRKGQQRMVKEWTSFQEDVQLKLGLYGSIHSIMWYLMKVKHPPLPQAIAQAEMATAPLDPELMTVTEQIVEGKPIRRITPVRVKAEPDVEYFSVSPDKTNEYTPEFNEEIQAYLPRREGIDPPFQPKVEEYTTDEDILSDSASLPTESDSSEAEEFEEKPEIFIIEDIKPKLEPLPLENSLDKVINGLRAAADGYQEIRDSVRHLKPEEALQLAQQVPVPPGAPIDPTIQRVIDAEGSDRTVRHLIVGLYNQEGATYKSVQETTGLKRTRLEEAITGKQRSGGSQSRMKSTWKPRKMGPNLSRRTSRDKASPSGSRSTSASPEGVAETVTADSTDEDGDNEGDNRNDPPTNQ